MKKRVVMMLVLTLALSVTGCGNMQNQAGRQEAHNQESHGSNLPEQHPESEIVDTETETTVEPESETQNGQGTASGANAQNGQDTSANGTETTTVDASGLSQEWTDMDFIFDGATYSIPASYQELAANGWTFNLGDYGYENGYAMNPGDKTFATIELKNPAFNEDLTCNVGFINDTDTVKDITECSIWSFEFDSCYGFDKLDNIPDMTIAKGITIGSTKEEVLAAFGETDDVYEATDYGYTTYEYVVDYTYHLNITVYDTVGVTAIEFEDYE